MLNSIILCEGETDQALVGCYIEKVAGWEYIRNPQNNPFPEESVAWYKDKNGLTNGIWQVGGNDFSKAIQSIFKREQLDHQINNIVIITDHDDQIAEGDRLSGIQEAIQEIIGNEQPDFQMSINQWNSISFHGPFDETRLQMLYLLVPKEEYGAMETYMMNAISEQSPEKEHVINESKAFINNFRSETYLQHRREKIKAQLGVSLSVFQPDRVFTPMKELIDSVSWESFSTTHRQFDLLHHLWQEQPE